MITLGLKSSFVSNRHINSHSSPLEGTLHTVMLQEGTGIILGWHPLRVQTLLQYWIENLCTAPPHSSNTILVHLSTILPCIKHTIPTPQDIVSTLPIFAIYWVKTFRKYVQSNLIDFWVG